MKIYDNFVLFVEFIAIIHHDIALPTMLFKPSRFRIFRYLLTLWPASFVVFSILAIDDIDYIIQPDLVLVPCIILCGGYCTCLILRRIISTKIEIFDSYFDITDISTFLKKRTGRYYFDDLSKIYRPRYPEKYFDFMDIKPPLSFLFYDLCVCGGEYTLIAKHKNKVIFRNIGVLKDYHLIAEQLEQAFLSHHERKTTSTNII